MVGGVFVELVKDSLLRLVSDDRVRPFFICFKYLVLTRCTCHPQPFARFHEQCVHSHCKAGHDLQKASILLG